MKPIVISAIPRRPHQRTNHDCQIGRPEALMRCAKNLISSITPPMNDKINPQIFSVLGVNMDIGTTSNKTQISHGKVSLQTNWTYSVMGSLDAMKGCKACVDRAHA